MSNQTEDLLQAGMERFTKDVDAPSGLAIKALRRRQRRRLVHSAIATAAVATAAGVAVAVLADTPAAVQTGPPQTAAYVINRVEAALAQVSSQNLIEYAQAGPGDFGIADSPDGSSEVSWYYHRQYRVSLFAADGRLVGDYGSVIGGRYRTTTLVNYQHKTWWRQTDLLGPPAYPTPKSSCDAARFVESGMAGPAGPADWAGAMRAALRCGFYTFAGTERVDGKQAIKLTPTKTAVAGAAVFWVDPATYLPVRDVFMIGDLPTDFQWRRPTGANLDKFDVTVPPGFIHVRAPSSFFVP